MPCGDVAGLAGLRRGFGCRQRFLRGLHGAGECVEVAEIAGFVAELLLVGLDAGDFLIEPGQPVAMGADAGFELVALGGEVGQRRGQFAEHLLGGGKRRFRFRHAVIDAGALFDARLDLFLDLGIFGVEPLQRDLGIRGLLLFARDIGGELRQPPVELGDALLGALFLAVEQFARIGEALQSRRGAGFALAERRQFGGADRLDARGLGLLAGPLGHFANVDVMGARGFGDVGIGFEPAQMKQRRLGLAHLGGDFAEADGLACLLLQAVDLAGELADHVLDAGEVGLGSFQPQLGFVAAGMKSGDAGGVFQHAAALFGLGLNDLADLALVNQRRRARARRRIGKQDLHVAGAHVAAVDTIGRTGLALDAAGDFQKLAVVDSGRRRAIGIVDRHDNFGMVARRAVAGAGEDHRVHVGGAQRFMRGLAHRPAQRLDKVRFAAAVRSDDAGETGFDHEISGFNERLETVEAEAREFHEHKSLLAGRESPCRDNTIEGNVGVWTNSLMRRLSARQWRGRAPRATAPRGFSQGN